MSTGDLPKFTTSSYGTSTSSYTGAGIVPTVGSDFQIGKAVNMGNWYQQDVTHDILLYTDAEAQRRDVAAKQKVVDVNRALAEMSKAKAKKEPQMPGRRVVRVFIIDPDPKVALEKSVLYKGEEILTDGSDQDLYFDIDVKALLDEHNKYRTSTEDETDKDKKKLKPIKVSNLIMQVVNIASF